jgi:hypothetical protein
MQAWTSGWPAEHTVPGIIYDTGALLAAERGDVAMATLHLQVTRHGVRPVVPAVVLAQAWHGGPQPRMSRLLEGCHILPIDEHLARAAGRACAMAAVEDVVDALVVIIAVTLRATVITSDPDDMHCLADALAASVTIHHI